MKKRIKTLCLLIILLSLCTGSVFAARVNEDQTITVSLIHTNDIHSRYDYSENNQTIGFAKLKTIINQENPDLTVDAGDIFHGQSFATIEEGASIAELMAAIGYDAMAPGNHDFNYGSQRLLELEDMADTTILGSNVTDSETGQPFFSDPYLIKTLDADGQEIKIGVFGLISPDIYSDTAPANVAGLSFGSEDESIETAQEMVATLKDQGCDVIVALTHIGDSDNGTLMKSDQIALGAPGIDVIVDGHTHDVENRLVGNTLIVQTGCYFSAVGEVVLTLEKTDSETGEADYQIIDKTENLITVADASDDLISADPDVTALVDEIEARQEPIKNEVVGSTPVKLGGQTDNIWQDVRLGEINLGRVLTDSYIFTTGADIAVENAGGIRAQIAAGDITKGQVIDVLPFGNYLVTENLSGSEIKEMLETSIEIGVKNQQAKDQGGNSWPSNSGSYLQWSGLRAEYDLSQPVGQRVYSVKVGPNELVDDQSYTIACNNYLATSSDYPALSQAAIINEYGACDEAFISYLQEAGAERMLAAINTQNVISGTMTVPEPDNSALQQSSVNPKTGIDSWFHRISEGLLRLFEIKNQLGWFVRE